MSLIRRAYTLPLFCLRIPSDQLGVLHRVREALQFSALLRQTGNGTRDYTREEKLAYAEEVISLLELGPIADALVGNAEVGALSIEERKRLTLGVELAARPDGVSGLPLHSLSFLSLISL